MCILIGRDVVMSSLERPKLRPVMPRRVEHQGQSFVVLQDPSGVVPQPFVLPLDFFKHIVRHFDGQSTLIDIQANVLRQTGMFVALKELARSGAAAGRGHDPRRADLCRISSSRIENRAVGRPRWLDVPTPRPFVPSPRNLNSFSSEPTVPAYRVDSACHGTRAIRGILSPHIDFQRGGSVYTWSYKELVENSEADTFVVLGVAHQYCRRRFALTCKDFETPLGLVADRSIVRRSDLRVGRA